MTDTARHPGGGRHPKLTAVLMACALGAGVVGLPPTAGLRARAASEELQPEEPVGVEAAIHRVRSGAPHERPYWLHVLSRLGPEALAETRAARDAETDPLLRGQLSRAASWQLAGKIRSRLLESYDSQLTFAGQYLSMLREGPELLDALLAIIGDSATELQLRFSACRALADALDPSLDRPEPFTRLDSTSRKATLTQLRVLYHDILIPATLREQIGILLAMLGDLQAVEASIQRLLRFAASANELESIRSHLVLSNLYYRIRDYESASRSYEKILAFYESVLALQKTREAAPAVIESVSRELALQYYNAACTSSLNRQVPRAMMLLEKAVRLDPTHVANLVEDGDLANVRRSPDFPEFLRRLRELESR